MGLKSSFRGPKNLGRIVLSFFPVSLVFDRVCFIRARKDAYLLIFLVVLKLKSLP